MTNKENQRYTIYYRPLGQWIEVSAEEKRNWENFVGAHRKAQQRAGRCCIPYKRCYKCDAHCEDCEYNCESKEVSIEEEMRRVYDGESSYAGFLSNEVLTAEIDLDRILINSLLSELKATDPASYEILMLFASGFSERECAERLGMPRNTYVAKRNRIIELLRSKL